LVVDEHARLEVGCLVRVVFRRGQTGIEKRLAGTGKRFVYRGPDDGESRYARCEDPVSGVVMLLNPEGLEAAKGART
jgi:hypothetical protein